MNIRRVYRDGVENDVYYGDVCMPHYHGVEGSIIELDEDFNVYGILDDGRVFCIKVKVDFCCDGCSVPKLLWRISDHPLVVPRVAAAIAHDWLYSAQVTDRSTADQIYRCILKAVGYSGFKAGVEYYALKAAGWVAWNGKTDEDRSFAMSHGEMWLGGEKLERITT